MAGIYLRSLKQTVTLWVTSPNGSGGDTFAAPVAISGRWEDRQETFIGQIDRREQVSKAIVYTDRKVSVGDYLALGDHTAVFDPTAVEGADKVQRYQAFPDLRCLELVHKSIL